MESRRLPYRFRPQPTQIKLQIEHLIEREFLKRDATQGNVGWVPYIVTG